ncbi:MAG: hypothetical protein KIT25_06540 [Enhydrobacter sp.]|nr:MAG: hypothetical protein KIT25_06540 [Enhydrobacter sp.]
MFTVHYLDHPQDGDSQVLAGRDYFWGSVGGPIYVLAKGFPRMALWMTLASIGIALAALLLIVLAVIVTSSAAITVVAIVGACALAIVVQGMVAVELVRIGFLQRGYREGYY